MRQICILLIFASILFSCKKDNGSSAKESLYSISGVAQKGPFVQGSKVTVYELNNKFEQTGKVFTTESSDDFGSFSLKDMLLTSPIVQVEVQGSSYNEIYASVQYEEMSLSNIVDLTEGVSINVNLLSDLSRQRFKYLVQNGKSFDESKVQAEKEVMKAFGLDSFYTISSDKLDITKSDDASGSLLALSSIFLTIRSQQYTMFLEQIASKYRADFETDGVLSDSSLISPIKEALYVVNPDTIKYFLSQYYKKEIGSFKKFVDIAKQRFSIVNPPSGSKNILLSAISGNLLLLPQDTTYLPDSVYSIDLAFPAQVYKKARLTMVIAPNQKRSFSPDHWDPVSNNDNQWIYEMKGIGLTSQSTFIFGSKNVIYLTLEDITDTPSKLIVQKWIGFNYH